MPIEYAEQTDSDTTTRKVIRSGWGAVDNIKQDDAN